MDEDTKIIRAAIDTEIDGYRYFLDAASAAAHPQVREVWLGLARDEVDHMLILQNQIAALARTGEWEAVEIGTPAAQLPRKAPISPPVQTAPAEFGSDVDALRAGLRIEDSTCRFYSEAAGRTESQVGRKVYRELAAMEMRHYCLIEETVDFLTNPAQWQFRQAPPIQEG